MLIALRSVDPVDKSFTMGTSSSLISIFGKHTILCTNFDLKNHFFFTKSSNSLSDHLRNASGSHLSHLGQPMWKDWKLLALRPKQIA